MEEYSLADLARITGTKRRALQLWAEAGAIKIEGDVHGGRGTYRRYSRQEAFIACLLVPLHGLHVAISGLVEVATQIRGALKANMGSWPLLEEVIQGKRRAYFIVNDSYDGEAKCHILIPAVPMDHEQVWSEIGMTTTENEDEPGSVSITLPIGNLVSGLR